MDLLSEFPFRCKCERRQADICSYLDRSSALTAGLVSSSPGRPAYMGVDYLSTVSAKSKGRPSVRITTQKSWTHGLFIADIAHMPGSICGVWPACKNLPQFWKFHILNFTHSLDVWTKLAVQWRN